MSNVFDKEGNELRTPVAFHPGEFLLEEIEERGLKKTEVAKKKSCRLEYAIRLSL
jgi:plasmid maintenance system antidote protein VapI